MICCEKLGPCRRLILVAGGHGTGKTRPPKEPSRQSSGTIPYLNVNMTLSERLPNPVQPEDLSLLAHYDNALTRTEKEPAQGRLF